MFVVSSNKVGIEGKISDVIDNDLNNNLDEEEIQEDFSELVTPLFLEQNFFEQNGIYHNDQFADIKLLNNQVYLDNVMSTQEEWYNHHLIKEEYEPIIEEQLSENIIVNAVGTTEQDNVLTMQDVEAIDVSNIISSYDEPLEQSSVSPIPDINKSNNFKSQIIEQFNDQIANQIFKNGDKFLLKLEPEELGTIMIEMDFDKKTILMVSSNEQVNDILREDITDIKNAFEKSGLEDMNFNFENNQQRHNREFGYEFTIDDEPMITKKIESIYLLNILV